MADKQLFNNAYNNFLENKDYEHFYESIKDLNITDNALFYFYKAQWAFKKRKITKLQKSISKNVNPYYSKIKI